MAPLVRINVRSDLDRLARQVDDLGKKQIPFAAARALSDVVWRARADVIAALPERFDRPTPFTLRAAKVVRAQKGNLRATVYLDDIQAKYLLLHETGGTRAPVKQALVLPVDITLNQYGNIPKGQLARLKGRGDVFVGRVNGIGGFWRRLPGDKVQLLVRFAPRAMYKPRFGYHDIVRARVVKDLPILLRQSLSQALASAKHGR